MIAIQKCGGTCIVQDPNEAEYPDMPLSVLNNMEVDHCVPLHQMGYIIYDTVNKKQISGKPVPTELTLEAEIAEKVATGIEYANQLGDRTDYSCPECGGGLWEMNEKGFRKYKCHVGHSYTQDDFMKEQSERLESTLWVAMRMMEERRNLLMKFGNEQTRKGLQTIAKDHLERADDLKKHINIIKEVLFATKDD
jgi:two-component system chemotaxis response regulator CheB